MSILLWRFFINPLLLTIIMIYVQISSSGDKLDLTTDEMLIEHGYSVSIHLVITSDGYKMKIHRIPRGRDGKPPNKKYPVVIPHMFLGSSADWVLAGPDRSLAMQLADDGFDVWLGNYRGNTYGREHVQYTTKENTFWDFSLHELGVRDLPAIIDFVIDYTKAEKIHYIGFSMSTTIFFIMASVEKDYQTKIKSCTLMAPVANIMHTTSTMKHVAAASKHMNTIIQFTRHGELISYKKKKKQSLASYLCKPRFIRHFVCVGVVLFSASGKDPYYFDEQLMPLIFGHLPAGTSSKLVQHFSQSVMTDSFTFFDYGARENLNLYGTAFPPRYPLNEILVPITLIYAENDILTYPIDVHRVAEQLPNVKQIIKVDNEHFNHFDFLFSTTVTSDVNNPVKKILQTADLEADEKYSQIFVESEEDF